MVDHTLAEAATHSAEAEAATSAAVAVAEDIPSAAVDTPAGEATQVAAGITANSIHKARAASFVSVPLFVFALEPNLFENAVALVQLIPMRLVVHHR